MSGMKYTSMFNDVVRTTNRPQDYQRRASLIDYPPDLTLRAPLPQRPSYLAQEPLPMPTADYRRSSLYADKPRPELGSSYQPIAPSAGLSAQKDMKNPPSSRTSKIPSQYEYSGSASKALSNYSFDERYKMEDKPRYDTENLIAKYAPYGQYRPQADVLTKASTRPEYKALPEYKAPVAPLSTLAQANRDYLTPATRSSEYQVPRKDPRATAMDSSVTPMTIYNKVDSKQSVPVSRPRSAYGTPNRNEEAARYEPPTNGGGKDLLRGLDKIQEKIKSLLQQHR